MQSVCSKVKFKYEPNTVIIDYENNKEMFKFNKRGEFSTEYEKLIEWIRKNKPFIKEV